MSTELAERPSGAVAEVDETVLAASTLAGLEDEELVLPILKVTQQLTREVVDEENDAIAGQFLNSVTGENYGNAVGLIICGYFKGRFAEIDDQVYVADGDEVPSHWPDEFAGKRFDELPEAEEQTKLRANAPGGQWTPPLIQTTHNYIGLVVDDLDGMPVRLSLKSTGAKVHRKIAQLLRFAPGGTPWSNVFDLRTVRATGAGDKPYFAVEANRGRPTTNEERQAGVNLAQEFTARQVKQVGEIAERSQEREAVADTGGIDVA